MSQPILWYFVDPMCSWCWGFAPTFEKIKETFEDQVRIAIIMGGLRPGGKDPVTTKFRDDILHHWHEVEKMTGAGFNFEDAMPEGFIYNTEIPSRAIIAVSEILSEEIYSYYKTLQEAFYRDSVDITQEAQLVMFAERHGIEPEKFRESFHSDAMHNKALDHFKKAREFGVSGFPSLILQRDEGYHLITNGYRPYDDIRLKLESALM